MTDFTAEMRARARETLRKNQQKPLQEELSTLDVSRQAQAEKIGSTCPPALKPLYFRALRGELALKAAVRVFCFQCVGWEKSEAWECSSYGCPLWSYRPGTKRPARKSAPVSDAKIAEIGEKMMRSVAEAIGPGHARNVAAAAVQALAEEAKKSAPGA